MVRTMVQSFSSFHHAVFVETLDTDRSEGLWKVEAHYTAVESRI